MAINATIIILGLWAPWIDAWGIGHLIEWLALELSRTGLLRFSAATPALLILAALIAAMSVFFRVWGTAYLGPGTVNNSQMVAGPVMADGPYRHVRNPLYVGLWFMVLALGFLMPVSGAIFAITLITVFAVRLTRGEEAFLGARLGQPYQAYLSAVPRFIPRFRGAPASSGTKPHWLRALLAELTPIGIFVAVIVFSHNYDFPLAGRIILVFFGASLVMRAFIPGVLVNSEPAP
jgi:protein-S-isoprenylcysteine O-methyltransferase Ste14